MTRGDARRARGGPPSPPDAARLGMHQRSLTRVRRQGEGAVHELPGAAEDARSGGGLLDRRSHHHRRGVRYAAPVPLPRASPPRPSRAPPGVRAEMPEPTPGEGGRVVYRLRLQDGLLYQDDPAFALGTPGATTRQVLAADVAFQLMRLADPKVNSPVAPTFARLVGFTAFTE